MQRDGETLGVPRRALQVSPTSDAVGLMSQSHVLHCERVLIHARLLRFWSHVPPCRIGDQRRRGACGALADTRALIPIAVATLARHDEGSPHSGGGRSALYDGGRVVE